MRYSKRTDNNRPIVRSNRNGPIKRELFLSPLIHDGRQVPLPYNAVKPYTAWTFTPSEFPNPHDFEFAQGFPPPRETEIAEALFQDQPTWESSIFNTFVDEQESTNSAILNAQEYGDLLMLVTAFEGQDTMRMIYQVYRRLWDAFLSLLKAAKRLNLPATLDVLSDLWLEYRYGWRPLMGEIEAVHKRLTNIPRVGIQSTYGSYKGTLAPDHPVCDVSEVRIPSKEGYVFIYDRTISARSTTEYVSKVGFNFVNKPGSRNDDYLALWGLDWQSLASTVWEMTPFSFVVDIFFNIGNCLQARDIRDQVSSFNGYRTCLLSDFDVNLKFKGIEEAKQLTLLNTMTPAQIDLYRNDAYVGVIVDFMDKDLVNNIRPNPTNLRVVGFGDSVSYSEAIAQLNETSIVPGMDTSYGGSIPRGVGPSHDNVWSKVLLPYFEERGFPTDVVNDQIRPAFYSRTYKLGTATLSLQELLEEFRKPLSDWYARSLRHYYTRKTMSDGYSVREWIAWDKTDFVAVELSPYLPNSDLSFTSCELVQRMEKHDFNHEFDVGFDISSGQFADLATLGWKFFAPIFR